MISELLKMIQVKYQVLVMAFSCKFWWVLQQYVFWQSTSKQIKILKCLKEDQENGFCLLMHLFYGYNSAHKSSTSSLVSLCTNLGGDHFDLKNLHAYENL